MANKSPYNPRNTRYSCERCGYTEKIGMFHPVKDKGERVLDHIDAGGRYTDVQCPKSACGALAFAVPRATSFKPRPAKKEPKFRQC